MARHFEYVIHGPPLPPDAQLPKRNKTLSSRHQRQDSNLRTLFQTSGSLSSSTQSVTDQEEQDTSSQAASRLPPTPPEADGENSVDSTVDPIADDETEKQRSSTITPVNQGSPLTPEITPPRQDLKLPHRNVLALRPSIASTGAQSFETAHENFLSEDEFDQSSPELHSALTDHHPLPDLSDQNGHLLLPQLEVKEITAEPSSIESGDETDERDNDRPSTVIHLREPEATSSAGTSITPTNVPITTEQLSEPSAIQPSIDAAEEELNHNDSAFQTTKPQRRTSIHEQVTVDRSSLPSRNKSLRDRVEDTKQIRHSASTEKFASIIGWSANVPSTVKNDEEVSTQRWSGISNISAVEAYVVDSPVKPQRRGTLRKVIKNDSLRSVSSPLPESKRTSLQSNPDSPHQLVHKKQKLNDSNRWSVSSDISKRSVSQSSTLTRPKTEVIKVAVIPERQSSVHESGNNSRRQSRSISGSSGRDNPTMPPVSTPSIRRKRAFSDSNDKSPIQQGPQIPSRRSSASVSTSATRSRANSLAWDPFAAQRQQAEKDLRSTLDRMESERLSSSLRQASNQSTPMQVAFVPPDELRNDTKNETVTTPRKVSIVSDLAISAHRPSTLDINSIIPGTKEWADFRNSQPLGTPFSQPSLMSASPEIEEAKAINFFPHNNNSLQLIEPNRLSESQAVRALKAQQLGRSNTAPVLKTNMSPRNAIVIRSAQFQVESPLKNPRKPPEPPNFNVIPPTPMDELDHRLGVTPDTSPVKIRTANGVTLIRPPMQGQHRSESFVRALSKSLTLRNARNPKAGENLDGTLHPFWRPRAFWDDDEYAERIQREQKDLLALDYADRTEGLPPSLEQSVTVYRGVKRSKSLMIGPASLMRRISERRKQRRAVDEHIAAQQALVKQTSYSSLQKFNAGRRIYAFPGRTLSLNIGLDRLRGLQGRMATIRARRDEERCERRREVLRKSIGAEVVSQGDSRYWDRGAAAVGADGSVAM